MSTPPETDFATQIMNAAITYDTPAAMPAVAMPPAETIADLERQIKKLKAETKATKKRAAERYTQMLHATRHAERTQEAFKREKEDRLDSEMKAVKAYCALKKKFDNLEQEDEQAQRSSRLHSQLQELYTSKNRLQADLAQKTMALVAAHQGLKILSSKSQEDKEHIRLQTKQAYDKALAEGQKLWKEDSAATAKKQSQELESTRKENELLREQLRKSQQALDWHKTQLQQQSAQRVVVKSSPMAAGIHAGFPLATQQSPSQATDQRKRRRSKSTGYVDSVTCKYIQADFNSNASLPKPEQQAGNTNTVVTPTRRKAPAGGRQPSQSPTTPTLLPQGLNLNASSMQPHQLAQAQPQARGPTLAHVQSFTQTPAQIEAEMQRIVMQATRKGTLHQFREFAMGVNARNQQAGRSPIGTIALWHAFKARSAQEEGIQKPGGIQFALQSPSQALGTPFTQHAVQAFNGQSPLPNQAIGFGAAQQMQTPQVYQQSQQSASPNYIQFQDGNLYPSPPEDLHGDPSANTLPVCVHCHQEWWNDTCDAGEPCQNCTLSGTSCERPKCHKNPG
jgi:hypothetical protein